MLTKRWDRTDAFPNGLRSRRGVEIEPAESRKEVTAEARRFPIVCDADIRRRLAFGIDRYASRTLEISPISSDSASKPRSVVKVAGWLDAGLSVARMIIASREAEDG